MPTWKTKKIKTLGSALARIHDEQDMLALLRDICTIEELKEIANRLFAAQLLEEGYTYRDVAKKTGMSTTTVTRIAHWLQHGEGGYGVALKKISF
ncbi:MAG: DNA-binding transcriptional regulator [Candidatus Magasanikbacteria bacterium]|jgi:TrpR-related protein YerC/YecD|nr:DNA-binding transcriptional regulator [Candidatus Magasanikbacteria bacterium]MBT5262340.1 DNA-binding transcriptional regulator [Candidatus Magasanikbacteria bacterium]MBT5820158.1 DNA-binding transcriptional regulator [Candidatus Magasanikbacteria bacterium]MBT6294767.1 DNA-binding transcriptional regulator [Candidatus Magasanikbacteria bacterium]